MESPEGFVKCYPLHVAQAMEALITELVNLELSDSVNGQYIQDSADVVWDLLNG